MDKQITELIAEFEQAHNLTEGAIQQAQPYETPALAERIKEWTKEENKTTYTNLTKQEIKEWLLKNNESRIIENITE